MPELTMPGSGVEDTGSKSPAKPRKAEKHRSSHRHYARHRGYAEPLERPALANVELLEPLPHPPQPPHATVPVPAYRSRTS